MIKIKIVLEKEYPIIVNISDQNTQQDLISQNPELLEDKLKGFYNDLPTTLW